MAQLVCDSLSLGYGSGLIIRDLSFEVQRGDYLCILGENGSGKTTLMKTILRLHAPSGGKITVGDGLKRNEIGYLPQQTEIQRDFPASVGEVVLSGCLNRCGLRPFYNKIEKEDARANMIRLGIEQLSDRCYRELSGGQQQRVLLARALCASKKMLLLDEPVSGLDPSATEEMYSIIESINRELGISVIMISHDMSGCMKYASHILHIGREIFFGTAEQYRTKGGSV